MARMASSHARRKSAVAEARNAYLRKQRELNQQLVRVIETLRRPANLRFLATAIAAESTYVTALPEESGGRKVALEALALYGSLEHSPQGFWPRITAQLEATGSYTPGMIEHGLKRASQAYEEARILVSEEFRLIIEILGAEFAKRLEEFEQANLVS